MAVKLTENAARILGEQARWAKNHPRNLPELPNIPLSQSIPIALFEIISNMQANNGEFSTTGNFVYYNPQSYHFEAGNTTDLPTQTLWYSTPTRASDGTANSPLPYQVGDRVWAACRGQWEIVATPPQPIVWGQLTSVLNGGDSYAYFRYYQPNGSWSSGQQALNGLGLSGASGVGVVAIPNLQTSTRSSYPGSSSSSSSSLRT